MKRIQKLSQHRRGTVAALSAILVVFLLAMVAFGVDVGYLAVTRNEAQNAADSGSLAGAAKLRELLQNSKLVQGVPVQTAADLQAARDEAKTFAQKNRVGNQLADVRDSDIEIGFLANPYEQNSALDASGWPARPYNAVRVRVARDDNHNGGKLRLFFAPVIGVDDAEVRAQATGCFMMGTTRPRGNQGGYRGGLLPFAYQIDEWNAMISATGPGTVTAANGRTVVLTDNFTVSPSSTNQFGVKNLPDQIVEFTLYPDRTTSGNYGTVNFSKTKVGNSTNVLRDLILNGPNEADWPDLPDIVKASPTYPVPINGDPGISAGMEDAVQQIIGQPHIIPLYSTVSGNGNNTYFTIVGFGPVTIVDVRLRSGNKYIRVQPRLVTQHRLIDGTNRIHYDMTPSATPNSLYVGRIGLVR